MRTLSAEVRTFFEKLTARLIGKCLHRSNGPAIEVRHKKVSFYLFGIRITINDDYYNHQVDVWYRYGKMHRIDGPAATKLGENKWALYGKEYDFDEYIEKLYIIDPDHALIMKLKYG